MHNFVKLVNAGGFVMYPLLALSFFAVATIIERFVCFKQHGKISRSLLNQVIKLVSAGQNSEALSCCVSQNGPLAASLTVILQNSELKTTDIERIVEETGQEYFIRLEQYLSVLDTATTVSPLLGLLGTVVGMIGAFDAIGAETGHSSSDSVLSGVGQALFSTATGLIIAIICFVFYNYFTSRLRNIVSATEQGATKLINVLIAQRNSESSRLSIDRSLRETIVEDLNEIQATRGT